MHIYTQIGLLSTHDEIGYLVKILIKIHHYHCYDIVEEKYGTPGALNCLLRTPSTHFDVNLISNQVQWEFVY